ncbi:MAG: hypothetical protein MJ240_09180 [Kiritimatiellae bacterium]|nr:hypothetical protein [Kiritimatiellia bacterium]
MSIRGAWLRFRGTTENGLLPVAIHAVVALGFALLSVTAAAEGVANLTATDPSGTSALTSAAAWDNPGTPFPSADIDYHNVGFTLKTLTTQDIVFGGRSLVLGTSAASGTLGLLTTSNRAVTFTGERGLVIVFGNLDCWHSYCTTINGNVSIAENGIAHFFAANMRHASSVASIVLANGAFTGPASAFGDIYIKAGHTSNGLSTDMVMHIISDTSQFFGTLRVAPYRDLTTPENIRHSTLRLGRHSFGGTVDLRALGVLDAVYADAVVDVANLKMESGATLAFRWDGSARTGTTFRVTNSLTVDGPVQVRPSALNVIGTAGARVAVLKAPAGVTLNPDDWVYGAIDATETPDPPLPAVTLEVAPDEDGLSTLWAVACPVVRMLRSDASKVSGSFNYDSSAPTNNWSDGAYPTPDKDYLIDGGYSIRPQSSRGTLVFEGRSLTFSESGGTMAMRAATQVVDRLQLDVTKANVKFDHYSGGYYSQDPYAAGGKMNLQGHMSIIQRGGSYAAYAILADTRMLIFDTEISGNGDFVESLSSANESACCFLEFTGDNSKWTGRLTFSTSSKLSPTSRAYLFFTDKRNLGGSPATFTHNALYLPWYGCLVPRAAATLDTPNRGIFVENGAVISNDFALTVCERITYAGALRKWGAGLLRLGGEAPRFTHSQLATPLVGTNVLDVVQGGLTPVSAAAFEGLAVRFAEGTCLALDAAAAPGSDVARYGMMLTNELSALTVPATGLPITVDRTATSTHKRLAICTVPTAVAAGLESQFRLTDMAPCAEDGRGVVLVSVDNGDGSTTLAVDFVRGLRLLLR